MVPGIEVLFGEHKMETAPEAKRLPGLSVRPWR